MNPVPRANLPKSVPTFHGARIDPINPGPVYFGIAAISVVAISLIFVNLKSPRRGSSERLDDTE